MAPGPSSPGNGGRALLTCAVLCEHVSDPISAPLEKVHCFPQYTSQGLAKRGTINWCSELFLLNGVFKFQIQFSGLLPGSEQITPECSLFSWLKSRFLWGLFFCFWGFFLVGWLVWVSTANSCCLTGGSHEIRIFVQNLTK